MNFCAGRLLLGVDVAVSPFFAKYCFCFKNTVFYSLEYCFLWAKVGISEGGSYCSKEKL